MTHDDLISTKKSAPHDCANSHLERFSGRNMRDTSPLAKSILAHFCLKRKPIAKILFRYGIRHVEPWQGGQKWLRSTAPVVGARIPLMRS